MKSVFLKVGIDIRRCYVYVARLIASMKKWKLLLKLPQQKFQRTSSRSLWRRLMANHRRVLDGEDKLTFENRIFTTEIYMVATNEQIKEELI